MITDSRIMASVTSYEMVCATARKAPIRAYFEFEAQPDHRIEYTAKLDMAMRKRSPRFRSVREKGRGRGIQMVIASRRANMGVMMKRNGEEVDGRIGSLINSLIPSATGCNNPKGPTMFGPFRACM